MHDPFCLLKATVQSVVALTSGKLHLLQSVNFISWYGLTDISTNIAPLSSFTTLNLFCTGGTQSPFFSLTLLGPSSLPAVPDLPALLSCQMDATNIAFLLFLLKHVSLDQTEHLITHIPGKMLCFGYGCKSSEETLYRLTYQQIPPRRKKMQASRCELSENAEISDSRRHEGKGLFLPVSHVLLT